ncbi:uncharacterized protein BDZ99DRAFT_500497 [Mytilinidion resinicola]|uniref:Uncharacterized protein n=1 Tax=Mytilinidion resinicola TaxID=574789 RepID=A0A6A6YH72_9PEZI|nr:uncharacterized protein BDZ99DRAFT_500497 [Mytilinidion resinicola]KAF2807247.1 hypothetical protein BDZ99DRAFT_500497 [Mytilinidion resinicola]
MSDCSSQDTPESSFASARENLLPPGPQGSANTLVSRYLYNAPTERLYRPFPPGATASVDSFADFMNDLFPLYILQESTDIASADVASADVASTESVALSDYFPHLRRYSGKIRSFIVSLMRPLEALKNHLHDRNVRKLEEKAKRAYARNKTMTDSWRDMRVPRRKWTILGQRSSGSRRIRIKRDNGKWVKVS